MEVGLFFGSFNPIHTGHMIIANLVREVTNVKEIWFVVSPQNPFKKNKNMLHEFDRLEMVERAIAGEYGFRACDIEFQLSRPSFTANTLAHMSDRYPGHTFRLIIGEDNLVSFPRWRNFESILEHYGLIVYPRPDTQPSELTDHPKVEVIDAPKMDISATLIRKLIKGGKSIKYLVPESVEGLIRSKGHYNQAAGGH